MDNCTTIITQSTKDAATLKFFPGRTVYATGVITFQQLEDCTTPGCMTSPVASELLELDGVQKLSFCQDFVLVTKSANTDWEELRPEVLMTLAHYSHRPYFQQSDLVCDDKTGCEVEAILQQRVRPVLATDGGQIVFLGHKDGAAHVHLTSACQTCPRAGQNLHSMIARLLVHYVAGIKEVVLV